MIRRHEGGMFVLIGQCEHARASGALAAHIGNDCFAPPSPYDPVVQAIAMHDSGWRQHDLAPTLNAGGLPLHVFDSPVQTGVKVPAWTESARLAAEHSPYSGLLVSLHVLELSIYAAEKMLQQQPPASPRQRFEISRFQQQQIDLQQSLRRSMGMQTQRPLSPRNREERSPAEQQVLGNLRLLQAMDLLSLNLCCNEEFFEEAEEVAPRPDAQPLSLRMRRGGGGEVHVSPWPFDQADLELPVTCRRVEARRYDNIEEFRQAFASAAIEHRVLVVGPGEE